MHVQHVTLRAWAYTEHANNTPPSPSQVALHYIANDFWFDVISSVPWEQITTAICKANNAPPKVLEGVLWLRLLRALRARKVIEQCRNRLKGKNIVRVVQMLIGFLIFAHYLVRSLPHTRRPSHTHTHTQREREREMPLFALALGPWYLRCSRA